MVTDVQWKWFPRQISLGNSAYCYKYPLCEDMCCLIQTLCHSLLVMGPMLQGHYSPSLHATWCWWSCYSPGENSRKTAGHTTFCSGNILISARIVALQGLKDGNPELAGMRCMVESTCCTDNPIQLPFKLHLFRILFNILFIEIHYRNTRKYKQISMKHGLEKIKI